jgi:endonuclease VIII
VPEGDTIWRAAARLAPALEGKAVVRVEVPRLSGPVPTVGQVVERVAARGKYLLVDFTDGGVLETHMKMTGSWHLYRPGERWRRARSTARVVLEVADWVAVCFAAPHVRYHPAGSRRSGPTHLGPDLTGPAPDLDEAADRMARLPVAGTPVAVALLDQRICCGVGNVYKSEVLHHCGLHPTTPVEAVDGGLRLRLVETAHRMLRANLGTARRRTVPEGLAVYGRGGEPCRRCGTPIRRAVHGEHVRSTYWCPTCQPAPGPPAGEPGGPVERGRSAADVPGP